MKFAVSLLLPFFFFTLSAQIRINPSFSLITKQKEFQDRSYFLPDFSNTDSIFIKEKGTGRVCQMAWCRWRFIIESEVFIVKDMEQVPNYLIRLKPKDKIIMEKIVLLPD